jgi:MFS family permease
VLVAGRLAQGAGAGAMAASALTLAASAEAARRAVVISTLTAIMAACAGGATLAGGAATVALSWRVTVALPALSLAIVPFCLRLASVHPGRDEPADVVGAGLLTSAVAAVLVLIQALLIGLSLPLMGTVALIAVAATVALVRRVRTQPNGFLPQRFATEPTFRTASATGFCVFGGFFGGLFVGPQVLVHLHGWSVFAVGVALLPGAMLGAALSRFAPRLAARLGVRLLLTTTVAVLAVLFAVTGATGARVATVIAAVSFGFIAFGITQAVLVNQVSAVIPQVDRGIAMGLVNLAFVTGGAVGAALAGALVRPLGFGGAVAAIAALPLAAAALTLGRRPSGVRT